MNVYNLPIGISAALVAGCALVALVEHQKYLHLCDEYRDLQSIYDELADWYADEAKVAAEARELTLPQEEPAEFEAGTDRTFDPVAGSAQVRWLSFGGRRGDEESLYGDRETARPHLGIQFLGARGRAIELRRVQLEGPGLRSLVTPDKARLIDDVARTLSHTNVP